jgi:hypothetical protein
MPIESINNENLKKIQNERCEKLSKELDDALLRATKDVDNLDNLKNLKRIVDRCIKFPSLNTSADINEVRFLASSANQIFKDFELHNITL